MKCVSPNLIILPSTSYAFVGRPAGESTLIDTENDSLPVVPLISTEAVPSHRGGNRKRVWVSKSKVTNAL